MKRIVAMVGLAACGGGGGGTADAPSTADAPTTADGPSTVDGPSTADGAAGGLVDVVVYGSLFLPDPTAVAIFVDVDGTVVQDAQVAADGTASAVLHPGGSVTVLAGFTEGTSVSHLITTIRAVKPGDHLVVGDPPGTPFWLGAQEDIMLLNVPPASVGNYVLASSPCQSFGGPPGNQLLVYFYASCDPSPFDLLVTSGIPSVPSDPMVYMWQPDNLHVLGGTIDLPDAWQPMSGSTVTLTNVPDYLHHLVGRVETAIGRASMPVMQVDYDMPAPGTHTMALQFPPTVPRNFLVFQAVRNARDVDRIVHFAPSASYATVDIDFDAMPVPRPTELTQTPTGATWVETTGTADARTLTWNGRWTSGPYTHYAHETVIEPWAAGAATALPVLPTAHAAEDPTTISAGLELTTIDLTYVDYSNTDYDGLRSLPLGPNAIEYNYRDVDHDAVLTQATQ